MLNRLSTPGLDRMIVCYHSHRRSGATARGSFWREIFASRSAEDESINAARRRVETVYKLYKIIGRIGLRAAALEGVT